MNIAELFIKLGVKGDSDSGKKVKGVSKSLGDMKTNGLAAKAALVGAVYGVNRLMSSSAAAGTEMQHFANATGLSLTALQKWEHAGRKANISTDEVRSAFSSLQAMVTSTDFGEGPPKALALLSTMVEDFDPSRMQDTFYLMEKIQEMAQTTSAPVAQKLLSSLGISSNMVGAFQKNAFNEKAMKGYAGYTKSEVKNLAKINSEWSQIFHKMEIGIGKVFAQEGEGMLKPLIKITDQVVRLTEATASFLKHTKALKGISTIFEGLAKVMMLPEEFGKARDVMGSQNKQQYDQYKSAIKRGRGDQFLKDQESFGISTYLIKSQYAKELRDRKNSISNSQVTNNINVDVKTNATGDEISKSIKNVVNKTYRAKAGGMNE